MKILLLRKSNCPYCDNALDFLRKTNHTIGVLQCEKRFDKFPKDIGWKPDIVFSFKNYMILPKKITDTLNTPSPIKEYSLKVVKMSISLKKSTYAAMSPLSERKSL